MTCRRKARPLKELGNCGPYKPRTKVRIPMKITLALFVLALVSAAPAAAQPATGMAAMQYYVGTWSCQAGPPGSPPSTATATFTLDSGVLHEWVLVPPQGKMTTPYALSIATAYDQKNARYVQTEVDSLSDWSVSYATPWTGNTEQWTDQATHDNKPGHSQTVRTNQNSFSFTAYPTPSSMQVVFQGTCNRSS